MQTHRITLVHALEESVKPARAAFMAHWPEAFVCDLLDTSLSADLALSGTLDRRLIERFEALGNYASATVGVGGRTAGILFTCSAFGPAIDAVKRRLAIPVLSPNEAAFEAALGCGQRIGLVVTFPPSAESLKKELLGMATTRGISVEIETQLAEGAIGALRAGNVEQHDAMITIAAGRLKSPDAIILGQFSMARAAKSVLKLGITANVISTPASAVLALKNKVLNQPIAGKEAS
jgi:Asp/Glu/hydantoin racemase